MNQPEPQALGFSAVLNDIERGHIKVPQFQRDFVWTKEKSAKLLDSILKEYPIGTFILWKTKEQLRVVRNLGSFALPETPEGDFVEYVLDGQQRLTSLVASVRGLTIRREDREDDFSQIFVDLSAKDGAEVVLTDVTGRARNSLITIKDLVSGGITTFAAYPTEYHKRLKEYQKRLLSYSFSVVLVREAPLEVVTEIFTRINVTGQPLSVFEIMVAKTFDAKKNFDLMERFEQLAERLREVNYDTISPAVILQAAAAVMCQKCATKDILQLDKNQFIEQWPHIVEALYAAVDYFRNLYRIPVSRLLPYASLLVPFSYFFYKHPDRPTDAKRQYLEDLFWRTALAGRYSHSLETRLGQDIERVNQILKGEPSTFDYAVDVRPNFILENGWFNAGRSFVKAILCLLAYQEPKSFVDNSIVRISNDWLKRANSKNYHHFFPRAFLERAGVDQVRINNIVNITVVDDFLNKREIRANTPSVYMSRSRERNVTLNTAMATHLIEPDSDGVWTDDYDTFLNQRAQRLSVELASRIIPRDSDSEGQGINMDDYEEPEVQDETASA